MYKDIMVYLECRDSELQKVGLELLGEAKKLATGDTRVIGVIVGYNLENAVSILETKDFDELIVLDDESFKHYTTSAYASVVVDVIKNRKPNIFLIGATSIGRDLAPRISARLNCGLTADCTRLEMDGDILQSTRPAFGGNLFATIVAPNHKPQMATVRPGVMLPIKDGDKKVFISSFIWEKLPKQRIKLIEEVKETKNVEKIEDAKVLVSFGRGIGSDENLECGVEIAKMLKGTYACTRALAETKRVEHERQVGQTGKTVKPDCYLAVGISGAIQHTVGMDGSEYIIAINKDRNAPIFQIADIGIVGDVNQILPLLNKEIKKEKNK